MNTTGNKTDEVLQLITLAKVTKGINDVQAVSYVAGLLYAFLTEEQRTEVFSIAGKNVSG